MSESDAAHDSSNQRGLSSQAAKEAYALFLGFDLNRNGSITPDEMKECMRRANIQFKDSDIDHVFHKYMDLNKDGKVSLDEYMKFMGAIHRNEYKELKQFAGDTQL